MNYTQNKKFYLFMFPILIEVKILVIINEKSLKKI